jgi:hypothetical protein
VPVSTELSDDSHPQPQKVPFYYYAKRKTELPNERNATFANTSIILPHLKKMKS